MPAEPSDLQRGNQLFVTRQYAEAIQAFAAHARTQPADAADCHERIAACHLATNIVTTPRPVAAGAASVVSMGNFELAEHHLRRALELAPKHFMALRALADLPGVDPDERAALLERALAVQPSYDALCDLGDYHRSKRKDLGKAEELYLRAIELRPKLKDAYTKIADVCRRTGRPDDAKAWLAKHKASSATPRRDAKRSRG